MIFLGVNKNQKIYPSYLGQPLFPELNMVTTIGWIALKSTEIHGPQRMNYQNFGNLVTSSSRGVATQQGNVSLNI